MSKERKPAKISGNLSLCWQWRRSRGSFHVSCEPSAIHALAQNEKITIGLKALAAGPEHLAVATRGGGSRQSMTLQLRQSWCHSRAADPSATHAVAQNEKSLLA